MTSEVIEDGMENSGLEFQVIYDEYHPRILRYLTTMVGEAEAEDLTQDVFIKISKALENFRGECKFSTWVYRIATNTAIDKMRTRALQGDTDLGELDDTEEIKEKAVWPAEEITSSEQLLMQKEMYRCFMDYVINLPASYRTIVVLAELEEFTNNEIAEILGLNLNVVKARLHRGRTKLIRELKSHCKAEDWL